MRFAARVPLTTQGDNVDIDDRRSSRRVEGLASALMREGKVYDGKIGNHTHPTSRRVRPRIACIQLEAEGHNIVRLYTSMKTSTCAADTVKKPIDNGGGP